MMLKAIGKYIDTTPIADLLSQDETRTDTIVFEVDRFHDGLDLSEFSFMIRGITESGGETQSALRVETEDTVLHLYWTVDALFTTEAGRLALDLFGYYYQNEVPDLTQPPDRILRYQLPDVTVRGLPDSDAKLESRSYTAFLLEVRAAADAAIEEINALVADFEAREADQFAVIDTSLAMHTTQIASLSAATEQQTMEIGALRADMTPVIAMTEAEFNALEAPAADTLYVLRAE